MSEPKNNDTVTESQTQEGLTVPRRKKTSKSNSDVLLKTLKNKRTLAALLKSLDKKTRDTILNCITEVCSEIDLEEQIAKEELQKKTEIVKDVMSELTAKGLSKDEIANIIQNL